MAETVVGVMYGANVFWSYTWRKLCLELYMARAICDVIYGGYFLFGVIYGTNYVLSYIWRKLLEPIYDVAHILTHSYDDGPNSRLIFLYATFL